MKFEVLIKEKAAKYEIPWQLVAAIIKQESNFDPKAKSPCNAIGLMQVISTSLTQKELEDPEINIEAGCHLLKKFWEIYKKEEGFERWKFAIASYNCGAGYVIEAQKKIIDIKGRPDKWYHVSIMLPWVKFREKKCDWRQTTEYVAKVLDNYYDYIMKDLMEVSK